MEKNTVHGVGTPKEASRRSFVITVGLRQGYADDGKLFSENDARRFIQQWQQLRYQQRRLVLSGRLATGSVLYLKDGEAAEEPCAWFNGEAGASCPEASDDDVRAALDDLARNLGEQLRQERVDVGFCDFTWKLSFDPR